MSPIPRSAVPTVAVDFMNRDHHEAVDLANELDALLDAEGNIDRDAVERALLRLVDHTREHFRREEEAMVRTGFPAYPVHKSEHDRVIAEMDGVVAEWTAGKDAARLASWVRGALPAWLVEHIETMDTVTAMFVANAGG